MAGRKRSLPYLGAQFGEVEVARGPDDGIDLLQRCLDHPARHDGERRLAHGAIFDRVVHQHAARAAELERRSVEIADRAEPGFLADRGCVGEQRGDHDVEQVEHVVLRGRLQRPHEGEQRRHAPLQRHSRHGLRLGDGREPGERRDPAGRDVIDGRQTQQPAPELRRAGRRRGTTPRRCAGMARHVGGRAGWGGRPRRRRAGRRAGHAARG